MTTNNERIKEALFDLLQSELKKIDSAHEARWIFEWIAKQNPRTLEDCLSLVKTVLERRRRDEPLAYIFGEWAFRDLELFVGPGVLIPRPETEELVELVIDRLAAESMLPKTLHIADLGAGSGAIGIAIALDLARKFPDTVLDVTFVERSPEARKYLEKNLKKYSPYKRTKVSVYPGSWNEWAEQEEPSSIDVLVSNPPYIPVDEWKKLDRGVREFEPTEALVPKDSVADPDALHGYEELLTIAAQVLRPGGFAFFEMGKQGPKTLELIRQNSAFKNPEIHFDIAGKKRFTSLRRV